MSKEAVKEFQKLLFSNKDAGEKFIYCGSRQDVVYMARELGFFFTEKEYSEYVKQMKQKNRS